MMRHRITAIVLFITFLAMIIGCLSCNPTKRATRHIHKAERIDPDIIAEYCSAKFPPIDSITERVIVKQGEVVHDTAIVVDYIKEQDTIVKRLTKYITKLRVDTVEKEKEIIKADRATLDLLNSCNTEKSLLGADADRYKKQRNWIIGILVGLVVIFFLFRWIKAQFPTSWIATIFKFIT